MHILGGEDQSRAEQAQIVVALGYHAEIYAGLEELLDRAPLVGIVLAADTGEPELAGRLLDALGMGGFWLPVVMTAADIRLERVVEAIRAGALDYLALPLQQADLDRQLRTILAEARPYEERRRREVEALRRILQLTKRERQVLSLLSAGLANKEIAHQLAISSRTVEIHRANMMGKLGARHVADAVNAWIAAGGDGSGVLGGARPLALGGRRIAVAAQTGELPDPS